MTNAADLHGIASRFRELARTEANGPLRKRLINLAWRCDQMAKGLAASEAAKARPRSSGPAQDPAPDLSGT